ncbi:hypothetical protein ACPFL9_20410 [Paenarthrobacter sp. NyZ202]|uniref:hypothetical protein n=1 Tax=Paenarthrobacter sp. NyZ202 TaxID=3402689 RepID=UPI003CF6FFD3
MDGTLNRVRHALAELPSLPLRVEESMKDGFGAITDSGEVPSFVFRNCGDAEAEAIVEILNATPALLAELELPRGAATEETGDSGRLAKAQLVTAYFRDNGTLPMASAAPDSLEAEAYKALAKLRQLARKGELEKAASRILDRACPGWHDGLGYRLDRAWQTRRDELIRWMKKHKRPPHYSSGDRAERRLASFVAGYRRPQRRADFPERIKELDTLAPGWDESPVWVPQAVPTPPGG